MQLAADDLAPGLFVTVLETDGPPRPEPGPPGRVRETKDYTAAGAVLRVVSVSLPFVLVQNMTPGMLRGPRMFPVDLRRSKLAAISDDYVRAAIGEPPAMDEPISLLDAEVIEGHPEADSSKNASGEAAPGDQGFGGSGIYFLGGS
jgi:hypothetical protein